MDNRSALLAPACEAEARTGLQEVHLLTKPDAHLLTKPDVHLTQPDAHLSTEPGALPPCPWQMLSVSRVCVPVRGYSYQLLVIHWGLAPVFSFPPVAIASQAH